MWWAIICTRQSRLSFDAEDLQWLTTAVGSRTQSEVVTFAQAELINLENDPDLVCTPGTCPTSGARACRRELLRHT